MSEEYDGIAFLTGLDWVGVHWITLDIMLIWWTGHIFQEAKGHGAPARCDTEEAQCRGRDWNGYLWWRPCYFYEGKLKEEGCIDNCARELNGQNAIALVRAHC